MDSRFDCGDALTVHGSAAEWPDVKEKIQLGFTLAVRPKAARGFHRFSARRVSRVGFEKRGFSREYLVSLAEVLAESE